MLRTGDIVTGQVLHADYGPGARANPPARHSVCEENARGGRPHRPYVKELFQECGLTVGRMFDGGAEKMAFVELVLDQSRNARSCAISH